jgi:transcriptional regulator with XRE-family HTH domain
VRLPTLIPEIRGKRTIREISEASGVAAATIRQIEQGRLLPLKKHVAPLEAAFGAPAHEWYPPAILAVLDMELVAEEAA